MRYGLLLAIFLGLGCGGDNNTTLPPSTMGSAELCGDGLDNDGDGKSDCMDSDCASQASCQGPEVCDNTKDDDGDGMADCQDTDCKNSPACQAAFVLQAHTSLTAQNTLSLQTNLPALVSDCLAVQATGVPCEDIDQDTLSDAWEDLVLSRFQPLSRYDEDESLVKDPSFVVANVGRVALIQSQPLEVHVFIMLGYSKDFGSCSFTAHNGDSERVALSLGADGAEPGNVKVIAAYTAGHEGTATDHSRLFKDAELSSELRFADDPESGEPRWVVFPSADKHATYANVDICENISVIPCFDEDCFPDGVANPSSFDRLPKVFNAGEELHPRLTDLSSVGFPGDEAWGMKDFCGGLGGSNCSAPVRDKLLVDPF